MEESPAIVPPFLRRNAVNRTRISDVAQAQAWRSGPSGTLGAPCERSSWSLRMEGVRVASVSPSGKLTLQAKGFLAEHRLLPLLRGRVKIDRIVIYEPRIVREQVKR